MLNWHFHTFKKTPPCQRFVSPIQPPPHYICLKCGDPFPCKTPRNHLSTITCAWLKDCIAYICNVRIKGRWGLGGTKIPWIGVDHDDEMIRSRSPPHAPEELVPWDYHYSGRLSDVVSFVKLVMLFGWPFRWSTGDQKAFRTWLPDLLFLFPVANSGPKLRGYWDARSKTRNIIYVAIICLYISYLYHRIHTSIASPSITTSK